MAQVTSFQVMVGFGGSPGIHVNLYSENVQVGRIDVTDLAELPKLQFTLDQLRSAAKPEWIENSHTLSLGPEYLDEP